MGSLSMTKETYARGGENPSQGSEDLVDLMARWVRQIAEPAQIGERTGTQINRSAVRLGMSPNQVKKLWYRERRTLHAHEYLHVKRVVESLEGRRELRRQLRDQIHDQISSVDERDPGPLERMARKQSLDDD